MPDASPSNHAAPQRALLRRDTLAGSVVILLALTGVQRMVGFLRAVLFCRWLDAEQLGQWDMAFGFLVLAAPLAILALPGSFGRYVERYRLKRQLPTMLRRTGLACAALTAGAVALIVVGRDWVAALVFGSAEFGGLVLVLAAALAAVISLNFMTELFTALRSVRLVAILFFINSVGFAAIGVGLLLGWRDDASSVIAAYGAANLISASVALFFLVRAWGQLPQGGEPLLHQAMWSRLLPFAMWVWVTNLMANLFEVADRYMIIHFSGAAPADALAMVGQYHSSRVVPVLLFSVAQMLGGMITPHLSADWEAGRRAQVSARLGLFLKGLSLALTAAGVAVLIVAPWLFGVALAGKFPEGRAVLPWTLTYCSWFGLTIVAQNYLWCAERAWLSSVALGIGLAVNVSLNLMLMPRLGLLGAVLATASANLVALALVVAFGRRLGLKTDRGLLVFLALPLAVNLGPWLAALVLAAVVLDAAASDRTFSAEEKRQLLSGLLPCLERLPWLARLWPGPLRRAAAVAESGKHTGTIDGELPRR